VTRAHRLLPVLVSTLRRAPGQFIHHSLPNENGSGTGNLIGAFHEPVLESVTLTIPVKFHQYSGRKVGFRKRRSVRVLFFGRQRSDSNGKLGSEPDGFLSCYLVSAPFFDMTARPDNPPQVVPVDNRTDLGQTRP
jgi:hypothetical protein